MSRVAKNPVFIPAGVEVKFNNNILIVKGSNGELQLPINNQVEIEFTDNQLKFSAVNQTKSAIALSGTLRAVVSNMVKGVVDGFEKKLQLIGVGYRAQAQGNILNLSLGFSHPVVYTMPSGISVQTPSQTEIIIKGADKQVVGQVAAELRAYRSPEPYKGKGIRYFDEEVKLKEAKKK